MLTYLSATFFTPYALTAQTAFLASLSFVYEALIGKPEKNNEDMPQKDLVDFNVIWPGWVKDIKKNALKT